MRVVSKKRSWFVFSFCTRHSGRRSSGRETMVPSMGFPLESLSMLRSCVPLIDDQAIEDPIHIAVMKPIHLAENPLLDKAESLGDCTTASVVCRTGYLDFMHLRLLDRMPHHRSTTLGYYTFSFHRSVERIAQFDFATPPVQAIVQNPYQGVLVPDSQVIAFAIDELEQSLFQVGSERLN